MNGARVSSRRCRACPGTRPAVRHPDAGGTIRPHPTFANARHSRQLVPHPTPSRPHQSSRIRLRRSKVIPGQSRPCYRLHEPRNIPCTERCPVLCASAQPPPSRFGTNFYLLTLNPFPSCCYSDPTRCMFDQGCSHVSTGSRSLGPQLTEQYSQPDTME
jgi:hypothetical protein